MLKFSSKTKNAIDENKNAQVNVELFHSPHPTPYLETPRKRERISSEEKNRPLQTASDF